MPDGTGKIAVGGVAHKPWRLEAADKELSQGARAVSSALLADARPTEQNRFKIDLVERTLGAILIEARV
ncbi:hypothetical protein D3C87_1979400 [compost metagenome]